MNKRKWIKPQVFDLHPITPEDSQAQALDDIKANLIHRFNDLVEVGIDPSILEDLLLEITEEYNAHYNLKFMDIDD